MASCHFDPSLLEFFSKMFSKYSGNPPPPPQTKQKLPWLPTCLDLRQIDGCSAPEKQGNDDDDVMKDNINDVENES